MPVSRTVPAEHLWSRILTLLAFVLLAYAVKNYLAFLASKSDLCPYLCPSPMGGEVPFDLPLLGALFSAQLWVLESLQAIAATPLQDPYSLATALVFAPLLEETLYRGPMYLIRGMKSRVLWWSLGSILTAVFALSHGRSGLALLPLIALGGCSLLLIANTGRLWPSIVLHFLYNFVFGSVMVYQSIWAAD